MDIVRSLLERGPFEYIDLAEAKRIQREHRVANGLAATNPKLFTAPEDNHKFDLTEAIVYGLSLAQAELSGWNVCRYSTPGCRAGCVAKNGNGAYDKVQYARIVKTLFLAEQPEAFLTLLMHELAALWAKYGRQLHVRLNTFSDIPWERVCPDLFERFPLVRFYDYTKWSQRETPRNYHLTYSASENTSALGVLARTDSGQNVAVVFTTKKGTPLPGSYLGVTVVDGDMRDDRWSDPKGTVIGLRAKGRMRNDKTGFVKEVA